MRARRVVSHVAENAFPCAGSFSEERERDEKPKEEEEEQPVPVRIRNTNTTKNTIRIRQLVRIGIASYLRDTASSSSLLSVSSLP